MAVKIMDESAIARTVTRLTHEILEKNKGVDDLVLVGIKTRGVFLAERIQKNIERFEGVKVPIGQLDISLYRDDRHDATQADEATVNSVSVPVDITQKHVVLVDDVLFTARTIRAAIEALLKTGRAKRITVAILVDRGHRELPIKADYVGKNIPTALNEQVNVLLREYDDDEKVVLRRIDE